MKKYTQKNGFVLMYSLLVASVVLVIGLTISNIIVKQIIISSLSREMNNAYYAANAGRECIGLIYYARVAALSNSAIPPSLTIGCNDMAGNDGVVTGAPSGIDIVGEAAWAGGVPDIAQNSMQFKFNDGSQASNVSNRFACAKFDLPSDGNVNARTAVDGNFNFVYARGYNSSCGDLTSRTGRILERVLCQDFALDSNGGGNNCRAEI